MDPGSLGMEPGSHLCEVIGEYSYHMRIYGLPKMHKPRAPNSIPPFRPIVSFIGTYNYNLAKFLSNLLQPHIPSQYVASDTCTFVHEIFPWRGIVWSRLM